MREYGSEHPAVVLPDGYFDSLSALGRDAVFLRSGREALLLAAKSVVGSTRVILFPAYCCWSMSAPFEMAGWRVVYYRLNEDLTVDIDYLKDLIAGSGADAVLTMNFYGSASTDAAVSLAKSYGLIVIEDFSHCTFSLKKIFNPDVDIYISSIRKSVGVCDGAILLSKEPMPKQYIGEAEPEFFERRHLAQTDKRKYSLSNNQKCKDSFLGEIRACECILNEFVSVRSISPLGLKMLGMVNGEEIAYARRENMKHLMALLDGKVPMIRGIGRCLDGAPFSLPILVENRDEVQRKLAAAGVYAPVLWPICENARKVCDVSAMISDCMLSIPVDQRYDWDDMEEIAHRIIEIV